MEDFTVEHSKHSDERRFKEATHEFQPQKAERVRTGGPSDYGKYCFCVKTPLSESGEIYVMADETDFTADGAVIFLGTRTDKEDDRTNLALAAGQWSAVYAASCWDGSAVAVEHWKGEVNR
jgi:hypothetical protein